MVIHLDERIHQEIQFLLNPSYQPPFEAVPIDEQEMIGPSDIPSSTARQKTYYAQRGLQ